MRKGLMSGLVGLLALASVSFPVDSIADQKPLIVLDPGHGMGNVTTNRYDPGAISSNGYQEADFNLYIAKMVGDKLTSDGYRVEYTRTNKTQITPLSSRGNFDTNAEIFVSIHFNSSVNPNAHGTQVFSFPYSKGLAGYIYSDIVDNVGKSCERKEPLQDGTHLRVLRDAAVVPIPAVLVETAYMGDEETIKDVLKDPKKYAYGIANGIEDYHNEAK